MFRRSYFRLSFPIVLILLFVPLCVMPGAYSAGSLAQQQKDLLQYFRNFEVAQIDPETAAAKIRQSGTLSIRTSNYSFDLELTQNDLRGPEYHAEEVVEGGFTQELPITPVHTYKGSVLGMPGAEARFTVDDSTLEGMIITSGEWYFVEAARNYSPAAKATDFLFYKASDVLQNVTCGVSLKERIDFRTAQLGKGGPLPEIFSPLKVVELATEADFDYVNAAGGSTAANNEILSLMNQVQGVYETQIGLTFSIVYQHSWATAADPYSATDSSAALNEFTDYWNANFASTNRDMTHLWTGRSLSSAGIAWVGATCSAPTFAYGVSTRQTQAPFRVAIPAHEIGHNFNASHSDGTAGCANSIMQSTATPSTALNFCPFSISEITNYVNSNSTCLSSAGSVSQLQFSATSYSAGEGAGSLSVTVTRTGTTSGTATVDFATTDGSALQRSDYTVAAGTLSFAAGETSKTVTVPVTDDLYVEGNETVSITLSYPQGATLSSPASASLTISDNDFSQPVTNPLENAQFFVRQHYYDFLNRLPDQGGLDYWTNQIASCGSDQACIRTRRISVSNAFFYEQEFQDSGAYVYRIYKAAFGTLPGAPNRANLTYAQFMPDRSRVVGGPQLDQSKTDFANAFVGRGAFLALYPNNMTAAQYVDSLNSNTGNSLTLNQRNALVTSLGNGSATRASVLRQIADNAVFIDREYNASFVMTEYFGYLRRDPDQGGYDFWLGQVNRFPIRTVAIQQAMVCSFVTSTEYQQRFSGVVTRNNGECPQ